jgi:hypothetical protein
MDVVIRQPEARVQPSASGDRVLVHDSYLADDVDQRASLQQV